MTSLSQKLTKETLIILDIKDYIDEVNRHLSDNISYKQLDFDPTGLHTDKIKSEMNNLKKLKPLDFKSSKLSFRGEI